MSHNILKPYMSINYICSLFPVLILSYILILYTLRHWNIIVLCFFKQSLKKKLSILVCHYCCNKVLAEWIVCVLSLFSHGRLCATLWTEAHWAPLSMEFSRQEYWSGLPCIPLGDLPNPGIKPASLMSPPLADRVFKVGSLPLVPPKKPAEWLNKWKFIFSQF